MGCFFHTFHKREKTTLRALFFRAARSAIRIKNVQFSPCVLLKPRAHLLPHPGGLVVVEALELHEQGRGQALEGGALLGVLHRGAHSAGIPGGGGGMNVL